MNICVLIKIAGIPDKTIVIFFAEKLSDDIEKFCRCFPSNYVIRFISFHSMMAETGARSLKRTQIKVTKRVRIGGISLIYIQKKTFLFDSFGFEGFKEFILKDDQKILNKILHGIEKFNKRDNKITLIITRKFFMQEHEKIKNMNGLSETAIDLLHLMNEYGKKHKLKDEFTVHLVDDKLQIRSTSM